MSLLENMAKQVVVIKDSIVEDILQFLDSCQCKNIRYEPTAWLTFTLPFVLLVYGREVQTILENPNAVNSHVSSVRFTVTYEARIIKCLLLQIIRN